jgi:uncharacterized membrane protein required for colicin V production
MKTIRGYLDGHIGDLILWSFAVAALLAYVITVMAGKADQTLGNVLMAAVGALGAFMQKRYPPAPQTTNVETANVKVNPPADDPDKTPKAI